MIPVLWLQSLPVRSPHLSVYISTFTFIDSAIEYLLSICDMVATLSVSGKTELVSYDVYYGQIDSKTTTAHIIYVSEDFYAAKAR